MNALLADVRLLCTERCELMEHFQYMWIQILGKKQSLQSGAVLLDLFMMLKDKREDTENMKKILFVLCFTKCIYKAYKVYHAM
jgi:hypothetical protein